MLTEDNMPKELSGRFFYLAEGDLSEGTSEASLLRPIYAEDITVSEPEAADMDKAAALWDKGVEALEAARPLVQDHYRNEFERERSLAAYLQTVFRAVSNGNHFFALRREFRMLMEIKTLAGQDRERALELVSRMEDIVRADLVNARRGLEFARRDPRLDLAVRLDLDYAPLAAIIEAKINYAETEVLRRLADARNSLTKANRAVSY
jgi:hypothetical protein